MSSFSSKVKKAEKVKATREKSVEIEGEVTTQQTEPAENGTTVGVLKEHGLYGEDQHSESGDKPKFERLIPLDRIRPNPRQYRKTFDQTKIEELASGMRIHGWIGGGLPARAHPTEANVYEIVWGERRWRAARLAGLTAIPCVISEYTDDDLIEKGLLENIQREDLSNLEEGLAYVSLLTLKTENGKPRYSIRRLAAQIGKDKSYIEDRLQYARVPIDIQQLAEDQPDISPRIIRELGELSKILQPEERAPVIEGVRDGKLRIEDVREIRQDIEKAKQEPQSKSVKLVSPVETLTINTAEQPGEQSKTVQQISVPPVSTLSTDLVAQDPASMSTADQIESISTPATSLTSTVALSVFEKGLKRDQETIDRVIQRVAETMASLTEPELALLVHSLKRWKNSIENLIQHLEPTQTQ